MADISLELGVIASGVYGKDIKNAIYQALYKINNDLNEVKRMNPLNYVEITEEAYEALTPSKQLNGDMYLVYDKGYIMRNGYKYAGGVNNVAQSLLVTNGTSVHTIGRASEPEQIEEV